MMGIARPMTRPALYPPLPAGSGVNHSSKALAAAPSAAARF